MTNELLVGLTVECTPIIGLHEANQYTEHSCVETIYLQFCHQSLESVEKHSRSWVCDILLS